MTANTFYSCIQSTKSYDTENNGQRVATQAIKGIVIKMIDQAHTLLSYSCMWLQPKTESIKISLGKFKMVSGENVDILATKGNTKSNP